MQISISYRQAEEEIFERLEEKQIRQAKIEDEVTGGAQSCSAGFFICDEPFSRANP
jgi:hypothetical protein